MRFEASLLMGLIFGPNGRAMSPSHTRRRGPIYRYYVTREAIADGYDSCTVTSAPAADVEGAVLDHIQKLLAAPELVARTWSTIERAHENEMTEREVTLLLADIATRRTQLRRHFIGAELQCVVGVARLEPCTGESAVAARPCSGKQIFSL